MAGQTPYRDAIVWAEATVQPLPHPWAGSLSFRSRPGAIVADVSSSDDDGTGHFLHLWGFHDGVAWTQRPVPPGSSVRSRGYSWYWSEMEFGYTAIDRGEDDILSGRWRYWVLGDGDAWVEVVGPPGQPVPVGGDDYACNRVVGSVIYWGHGDRSTETVWVGRFDS